MARLKYIIIIVFFSPDKIVLATVRAVGHCTLLNLCLIYCYNLQYIIFATSIKNIHARLEFAFENVF